MRILALDASTEMCTVALGGEEGFVERAEHAGQRHSELLLPMIQALLADAGTIVRELDGIAFGAGPGSFTGLRIACGIAQGLGFGADLPLVGVSTLAAMAEDARARGHGGRIYAALDARMREAYIAAYEHDGTLWHERVAPAVLPAEDAPSPPGSDWYGVGPGFAAYPELHTRLARAVAACDPSLMPSAVAIGTLALPRLAAGEGTAAGAAAPLYVRHRVALTTAERAAGSAL
ncbi:MAG: tRNA (adenosine(37)-N6)-threonylcarbamoyltransferase complex dimerization subunit type 1 TsaB [Casimicrobiaceae bacterium]